MRILNQADPSIYVREAQWLFIGILEQTWEKLPF